MSKKNSPIVFRDHLPKVEKVKLTDYSTKKIGKAGNDFMKLGEENGVDFNAFFVMFSVWLSIPAGEKEAVILQLVKDGKVNVDKDARKSSEGE